ncbi:MAG: dynamin family protein [Bryobacteraceae bacterium]
MSTQASLSSYMTLKLRLGSVMQNLLAFAQGQKDEERSRFIQNLLADLADDTFRLALFGKYNRGKSTLINALLGVERLPTGILPLTSVITTVRYDSQERVLVQREGWIVPQQISLEQLSEYVTENGNPGNEKQVTVAQIMLPADILRYGFFLVDTPGTGSSILANTKTAESFLSRADAAIVVMSVESPLDEEELALLERVHREIGKVFVVLNKADLISDDERRQISDALVTQLRALIQDETPVFVLSARNAMKAREEGLEKLVRALLAFMATEKTGQFLKRMAERAADLIRQEQFSQLLLQKTGDKQSLIRDFERFVGSALEEGTEVMRSLKSEPIERNLRPYIAEWRANVERDLLQSGPFDLIEYLRGHSALRVEAIHPDYAAAIAELEDLIRSVHHREQELTGANDSASERQPEPLHKFKTADWIPAKPPPPFSPPQSALSWVPAAGRKAFSRALDAYCGEIRRQLQSVFQAQVVHVIQAFAEQLKTARERVTRMLGRQGDPRRVQALKQLSQELEEVVQEIASAQGLAAESRPAHAQNGRLSANKCAVCEHLTTVIFQFMRAYPYRLLTDPEERNRNAERGGLCPFHTWMYESISSPQGICAGYARVLLHIADELDGFTEIVADIPAEIERRLRELAKRSDLCIACQVIDAAYTEKLQEIAATPERLQASTLCLPHLCVALLRDGQISDNLPAIDDLADRLRRMGEDMQQFALKRSGLRYGWTSSAEKAAYANGLMMVAAARPISYVKQVVEIGT